MNAKEKAKQLVSNYRNELVDNEFINSGYAAKKCAIIAVDELIKEQTMWQNGETDPVLFWQSVKSEIEKL